MPVQQLPTKGFHSISEASRFLSLSKRTIARMITAGELHSTKIRSRRLISTFELERLLTEANATSTPSLKD